MIYKMVRDHNLSHLRQASYILSPGWQIADVNCGKAEDIYEDEI